MKTKEEFTEELDDISRQLHQLEKEEPPTSDPDGPRRALYARLELLRMDYTELPHVAPIMRKKELDERQKKTKPAAKDKPIDAASQIRELVNEDVADSKADSVGAALESVVAVEAEVNEMLGKFNDLRDRLRLRAAKVPLPQLLARLALVLVCFCAWVPILFIMAPIRLLNPTLRKLGVRNNYLPSDMVQKLWARNMLMAMGVNVLVEGEDNIDDVNNSVAMFTHASNLDPWLVESGPLAFKFIGKKSLFLIPVLGWIASLYGHIGIERGDLGKAIQSYEEAAKRIHYWGRSISISPEGTRSTTGRLLDFKKGLFHLATQVNLPLTPIIIIGAYELWPPGQLSSAPGTVTVRFLPKIPIAPQETPGSLCSRARRTVLQGTAAPLKPGNTNRFAGDFGHFLAQTFLPMTYAFLWGCYIRYF